MPVSPVIISQPSGYNIGYNPSMPQKGGKKVSRTRSKKKGCGQKGGKINWAKVGKTALAVNKFLRDNKVISRTAGALSSVGVPYAGSVSATAAKLGYGKQRGGAVKFR